MITAQDVLDLQKGSKHWGPRCELRQRELYGSKAQQRTLNSAQILLKKMGPDTWTVTQLCEETDIKHSTIRDSLNLLIDKGHVTRSTTKQPYLYWRV